MFAEATVLLTMLENALATSADQEVRGVSRSTPLTRVTLTDLLGTEWRQEIGVPGMTTPEQRLNIEDLIFDNRLERARPFFFVSRFAIQRVEIREAPPELRVPLQLALLDVGRARGGSTPLPLVRVAQPQTVGLTIACTYALFVTADVPARLRPPVMGGLQPSGRVLRVTVTWTLGTDPTDLFRLGAAPRFSLGASEMPRPVSIRATSNTMTTSEPVVIDLNCNPASGPVCRLVSEFTPFVASALQRALDKIARSVSRVGAVLPNEGRAINQVIAVADGPQRQFRYRAQIGFPAPDRESIVRASTFTDAVWSRLLNDATVRAWLDFFPVRPVPGVARGEGRPGVQFTLARAGVQAALAPKVARGFTRSVSSIEYGIWNWLLFEDPIAAPPATLDAANRAMIKFRGTTPWGRFTMLNPVPGPWASIVGRVIACDAGLQWMFSDWRRFDEELADVLAFVPPTRPIMPPLPSSGGMPAAAPPQPRDFEQPLTVIGDRLLAILAFHYDGVAVPDGLRLPSTVAGRTLPSHDEIIDAFRRTDFGLARDAVTDRGRQNYEFFQAARRTLVSGKRPVTPDERAAARRELRVFFADSIGYQAFVSAFSDPPSDRSGLLIEPDRARGEAAVNRMLAQAIRTLRRRVEPGVERDAAERAEAWRLLTHLLSASDGRLSSAWGRLQSRHVKEVRILHLIEDAAGGVFQHLETNPFPLLVADRLAEVRGPLAVRVTTEPSAGSAVLRIECDLDIGNVPIFGSLAVTVEVRARLSTRSTVTVARRTPGTPGQPVDATLPVDIADVAARRVETTLQFEVQPNVRLRSGETALLIAAASSWFGGLIAGTAGVPREAVAFVPALLEAISGVLIARNQDVSDVIAGEAPLDEFVTPLLRSLVPDPSLAPSAPTRSQDPVSATYTLPDVERAFLGADLLESLSGFGVRSVSPRFRTDAEGLHLLATLPDIAAEPLFVTSPGDDVPFRTLVMSSTTWQPCGLLAELDTRRRSPAPTPPSQREVTFNVSLLCQGPATTIVAMRIRDEALQRLVATGAVSVVVTLTTASNETRPVRIPTRVGTGETVTITLPVRAATLVAAATAPSEVRLELVTDGGLHVLDFSDSLGALSEWAPLLAGDLDAPPAQALERWLRGQCGRVPDVNERFVLRPPLGANLVPASRLRMEGALRELPPVAGRFEAPRGAPPRFEDVVVAAGRAGPSILDLALRAAHARASPRAA